MSRAAPPRVHVMLACNDYRNGVFDGRAEDAEIGDRAGNFLCLTGPAVRVQEGMTNLQIGREVYRCYGLENWYGNWCWNRYELSVRGVVRLLGDLHRRGWSPEEGTLEWYERFARGEAFTEEILTHA